MPVIQNQGAMFSLYSVTNADMSPTETLIKADVPGSISIERERKIQTGETTVIEKVFLLILESMVIPVDDVTKIVDNSGRTYHVEYVEDFNDHQEFYVVEVR